MTAHIAWPIAAALSFAVMRREVYRACIQADRELLRSALTVPKEF